MPIKKATTNLFCNSLPSKNSFNKRLACVVPSQNWYAKSYLAIDQGPIIIMIENYRTGLLWKLFMSCPEISKSLKKLGFESHAMKK